MEQTLTQKDQERALHIQSCIAGQVSNAVTALKLGITVRQVRRLKRAVEEYGEQGVVHGNRGKTSPHALGTKTRTQVVTFLKKPLHKDFGPTFAQEKLAQQNIILSDETVRTIMVQEKLWSPHVRRHAGIHRDWRPRMGRYGELVQFDGSYHNWFEGRDASTEQCLLAAIDDATGRITHIVFEDNEGVRAVFRFWWAYILLHGLPVALYLDKFSTYKVNHVHAVDNTDLMTQFERVMQALDIRLIHAHSPEAKGRVERLFGTLQDRLVKEMRLITITDRVGANTYLTDTYRADHNARFSVVAREQGDAHRPCSPELLGQLPALFSLQSTRYVHNDYTIQFKNNWYQLSATQHTTVYKGDTVTIEERMDDTLHLRLKDTYLAYTKLPERPRRVSLKVTALTREKPLWKPPLNHPWRGKF
jgi:hypothetical protein